LAAVIDHPLDPANKYLNLASVVSAEMANVYSGNVTLDSHGEAVVPLPAWFAAANGDFRYQLTSIGAFMPVYVADEIANSQFKIAGGLPGRKVSWQVTGVRQDAWAKAHALKVETEKPAEERGYYLHPALYGAPAARQVTRAHPGASIGMSGRKASPAHEAPVVRGQLPAPPAMQKPVMKNSPARPQKRTAAQISAKQ
jgi:hypothetical protein